MTLQSAIWPILLVLLFFWGAGVRTRLSTLRQLIQLSFGQLHLQMRQRHAMLDPFLPSVGTPESDYTAALERVMAARAQVMAACDLVATRPHHNGTINSLKLAEEVFQTAMSSFLPRVPAHALIKANEVADEWHPFAQAWLEADKRVSYAKQVFNDHCAQYNQAVGQWPTRVAARLMGFGRALAL